MMKQFDIKQNDPCEELTKIESMRYFFTENNAEQMDADATLDDKGVVRCDGSVTLIDDEAVVDGECGRFLKNIFYRAK